MEKVRYAINKRTGNPALAEYSIKNIEGIGRQEYSCLECGEKLHLKKGDVKAHHFAHEAQEQECSYYSKKISDTDERIKIKHDERIHQLAIKQLKMMLENNYKINPIRRCSAKKNCKELTTDVIDLEYNHTHTIYETEYPIIFNGAKRKLDLVRIDDGKIKYIFEILDCNRTAEESRPAEYVWFELYADDIIKISSELDSMLYTVSDGIIIDCQRQIFKCLKCFDIESAILKKREEQHQKDILQILEQERLREEERKAKEEQNKMYEKVIAHQAQALRMREEQDKKERHLKEEERQRILEQHRKERKKMEEERQKEYRKKEKKLEEQKREQERVDRIIFDKKNKKCLGCNINNCKCETPNFITKHNMLICNNCTKRKCGCVRINTFFKGVPSPKASA